MQTNSYRRTWPGALALVVLVLAAGTALAQTPQTIIIDGVNDFLPVNVADVDTADTQFTEIDLSYVSLTNDAVNLYVGVQTGPVFNADGEVVAVVSRKSRNPGQQNIGYLDNLKNRINSIQNQIFLEKH